MRKLLMMSGLLLWLSKGIAQVPVADFSATPTSGCGPLTVYFTDKSSNSPTSWTWDFGNGQQSNAQNPHVTYTTPGVFNVRLIVHNGAGAGAVEKDNYITVFSYPSPKFTSNYTLACTPANIQFTDESSPGEGSITSWNWDLGDGSTSTVENPSHTYTQTGYYNITLKVANSNGCSYSASVTRYLRILGGVQPNFAFNQSSTSCAAPFTGQLLNQSAGPGNLSYAWTMSNGATPATSADTSPIVTFPNGGQYNVALQVSSSLGCSATAQQTLSFSNNSAVLNGPATACVNTPETFTDGSTPLPATVIWDFGDGTGGNTSSVIKTFTATGTYQVKLVNKYTGCADSTIVPVQVVNAPVAAFTATPLPASACQPSLTVNFTDQTTPAPTAWSWDFGDGQTSSDPNPSHVYSNPGSYTVKLTVTGAGGCTNTLSKTAFVEIQEPTVTIGGKLANCTAASLSNNAIGPSANVDAVDGVPSSGYSWSAPGSNEGSSTSPTPIFHYPNAGTYTLTVTVTTNGGCQATASAQVQIGTPTPANFAINPNLVCGNDQVTFDASASTPADHWAWDYGDGSGSKDLNQPIVTHNYSAPGAFPVLLVLTHDGCPTDVTKTITVNPAIPNFGYKVNCPNFLSVSFIDSSFTDASPTSYTWDFGDGSPAQTITGAPWTPTYAYAAPGTYSVTLTIVDGTCTNSITKNIVLGAVTPDFGIQPNPACRKTTFLLYSQSTTTPANPNFIAHYTWQIGADPAVLGGSIYNSSISVNGDYPVTMTAIDINGCTYTAPVHNIQVIGPTAQFTEATGGGCKNSQVTFSDQSTPDPNPIQTWSWDFGDGTPPVSETAPYTHVFTDTGYFPVRLIVTDQVNCTDTFSQIIQITSPIANFSGPDSFYCPGVPLTFIDSSQGYGLAESWNFGDGSASPTPIHIFANSGQTYPVTLTVTDSHLCTNSMTKQVLIQRPIAAFNIYDTTGICIPLETIFAGHGQFYDSLYWNFGDNTSSTLDSTSHFYNDYGIDTAKLYLQGPGGCLDSASRRILVTDPVSATGFAYSPQRQCDSVLVAFHLTPPPYTLFTLNFRDNTADSSQDLTPQHMYYNIGSYEPTITLTDATGCIVSIDGPPGPVTVLGSTPFFTVSKQAFCDSGVVAFTDFTISNDGLASETYTFGDGTPDATLSPGNGKFDPTHYYAQPGQWLSTLKITTTDNCSESYADTIHVYQTPHPVITIPTITCMGLVPFQGSTSLPEADSVNWSWNFGNGQTSQIQDPSVHMDPGSFVVTLKASVPFGCSDATSSSVTVNPLPEIKGPHQITTPVGTPVTIPWTYSTSVVTYNWIPADNLDCSTCANPVATVVFPTTYIVTVTDSNGCNASDTILIRTICNDKNYWFPNTFSPNGDGVNDYFYPRGTNLYNIQSLTIFNRWGQMVFQRRDFPANAENMGWDGTFAGKPAPSDAYVYIAQVVCENAQVVVLSGNVTLIR